MTTYTHQQHLNGECTHREFYAQYVTPQIVAIVRRTLPVKAIMASTDEHLNDIPLAKWDNVANAYSVVLRTDYNSLAQRVCLLKEAAKQIREGKA